MVLLAMIGVLGCVVGIANAGSGPPQSSSPYVIAPTAGIHLGPTAQLPVSGRDSEYPELAMNTSGGYLVAYPTNEPFGPFGVLSATTASSQIPVGRTGRLGTIGDLSPVQPAVAGDGRLAIGWAVRRGVRRSPYPIFGLELAERTPGLTSPWTYQQVLAPTPGFDPVDLPAGIEFDASDRLFWSWTTRDRAVASLVLARQLSRDGPWRTHTAFRAGNYTTIALAPIGVDSAGDPVLAWSLQPAASLASSGADTVGAPTAMAATTTSSGQHLHVQVLRRGCYVEQLAVAPSGQAAASMDCPVGHSGTQDQVWVSERPAGRTFENPLLVAANGKSDEGLSVTIAADGRLWATWDQIVGTERSYDANIVRTQVSSALLGRPFPAPNWTTTPYPTQLNGPQLLIGPAGSVVLARGDGLGRVVLQQLTTGRHVGPAIVLSPRYVRNQELAIDADGRGIALWDAHTGGGNIPEARRFTLP
jgi:hypothetical protein